MKLLKNIVNCITSIFQNEIVANIMVIILLIFIICYIMVILAYVLEHNKQREKEREAEKKLNIDKNSEIWYTIKVVKRGKSKCKH